MVAGANTNCEARRPFVFLNHRWGAFEISRSQRKNHGPERLRARRPKKSPGTAPPRGFTHALTPLDPSTGGNAITGFCPKNSEARNVAPAVRITYIRASHGLSTSPEPPRSGYVGSGEGSPFSRSAFCGSLLGFDYYELP